MCMPNHEIVPQGNSGFKLAFGNGGEVWAEVQSSEAFSLTGRNFLTTMGGETFSTRSVMIDINRPLADDRREEFEAAIKEFAEEQELPAPSLQPRVRICTDWPGLSEERIPEVMRKMVKLVSDL